MIPYVTEGLGIGLALSLATAGVQTIRLDTYKAELKASQLETVQAKKENIELVEAIDETNAKYLAMSVDLNASIARYNDRVPVDVFVDSFTEDSNLTRGNCEDTSNILDYVRNNSI